MLASLVVIAFAPLVPFGCATVVLLAITTLALVALVIAELRWQQRRGGSPALEVRIKPFRP